MTNPASSGQLALILNDPGIDSDRAQLLLDLAYQAVSEVLTPVPSGAYGVILDVAARAYIVPPGVTNTTVGPETAGFMKAGVYLTRSERRRLRAMSGAGIAFSIDPTPSGAGSGLAWWDMCPSGGFPLDFFLVP